MSGTSLTPALARSVAISIDGKASPSAALPTSKLAARAWPSARWFEASASPRAASASAWALPASSVAAASASARRRIDAASASARATVAPASPRAAAIADDALVSAMRTICSERTTSACMLATALSRARAWRLTSASRWAS